MEKVICNPPWISVDDIEQLPLDETNVIVYNGNFVTTGYYSKSAHYDYENNVVVVEPREWKYSSSKIDWKITHFMYIPELPHLSE